MSSFNATRGRTVTQMPARPAFQPAQNTSPGTSAGHTSPSGAVQIEECLAVAALAMQDWDAVSRHCERLVAETPERFEIWLNLAAALIQLGRGEEAAAAATQAVRLQPSSGEAHLNLAFALHQAGHGEQAMDHYRRAIQLGTAPREANWNLALLEADSGEAAAAVKMLTSLKVDDAQWKRELQSEAGALLLALDRASEAVPLLEASIREDADDLNARYNLGVALYRCGQAGPAVECFDAVQAQAPGDVDVLWAVASAASAAGDGKRLSVARRSLRDHGEAVTELTFNLALHLEEQGRDTDALRAYSEVLKERPLCAEALANLSHVLLRLGQEEQSRACWQRAVALKPEFANA